MRNYRKIFLVVALAQAIAGCARAPLVSPPKETLAPAVKGPGIYHKVARGETLWRISKTYGVELEKIVAVNGIRDEERIVAGGTIFIPSASKILRAAPSKSAPAKEDFIWPVRGKIILSFGEKRQTSVNKGIDIQAKAGTTVVASRGGKVIFCDEKVKGYGKTLILDHGDGLQTLYAHNSEILAKIGQGIERSYPIAKVGSTGRARLPYLHFEIRKGHNPQNPLHYLSIDR